MGAAPGFPDARFLGSSLDEIHVVERRPAGGLDHLTEAANQRAPGTFASVGSLTLSQ